MQYHNSYISLRRTIYITTKYILQAKVVSLYPYYVVSLQTVGLTTISIAIATKVKICRMLGINPFLSMAKVLQKALVNRC